MEHCPCPPQAPSPLLPLRWTWLYALSVLPGTLAHEAMHWLAGWLFGARPVSLSILPFGSFAMISESTRIALIPFSGSMPA